MKKKVALWAAVVVSSIMQAGNGSSQPAAPQRRGPARKEITLERYMCSDDRVPQRSEEPVRVQTPLEPAIAYQDQDPAFFLKAGNAIEIKIRELVEQKELSLVDRKKLARYVQRGQEWKSHAKAGKFFHDRANGRNIQELLVVLGRIFEAAEVRLTEPSKTGLALPEGMRRKRPTTLASIINWSWS